MKIGSKAEFSFLEWLVYSVDGWGKGAKVNECAYVGHVTSVSYETVYRIVHRF